MYCYKCGAELPDDSEYCNKCGAKLKGDVSQSALSKPKNQKHIHTLRNKIKSSNRASISALFLSLVSCMIILTVLAKISGNIYVDYIVLDSQKSIVALEKSAPILYGNLENDTQELAGMQVKFVFSVILVLVLVALFILSIIIFIRILKHLLNRKRDNSLKKEQLTPLLILALVVLGVGICVTISSALPSIQLIQFEMAVSNENNSNSSSSDLNTSTSSVPAPEIIVDSNGKKIWKVYYTQPYLRFNSTYTGTGNFIIDILDSNQDLYCNVVNEIGDYQLNKTVKVPSNEGYYYIQQQISHGSTTGNFYPSSYGY